MQHLLKQYVSPTRYPAPLIDVVFCSPPEGAICLTCGTHLALGNYGAKPAVVPRKKKKKRRVVNGTESASNVGTPVPGE